MNVSSFKDGNPQQSQRSIGTKVPKTLPEINAFLCLDGTRAELFLKLILELRIPHGECDVIPNLMVATLHVAAITGTFLRTSVPTGPLVTIRGACHPRCQVSANTQVPQKCGKDV
eukprot:s427_g11.t1